MYLPWHAGASNVISGATNFTIDIRSAYDAVRNAAVEDVRHQIHLICERRGLACEVRLLESVAATCGTK